MLQLRTQATMLRNHATIPIFPLPGSTGIGVATMRMIETLATIAVTAGTLALVAGVLSL